MIIRIKPKDGESVVGIILVSLAWWWLTYMALKEFVSGRMAAATTSSFTAGVMFVAAVIFGAMAVTFLVEWVKSLGIKVKVGRRKPSASPPPAPVSAEAPMFKAQ